MLELCCAFGDAGASAFGCVSTGGASCFPAGFFFIAWAFAMAAFINGFFTGDIAALGLCINLHALALALALLFWLL